MKCSTPAKGKPRKAFALRGLLTLAAIYSRGTCRPTTIDVLMFHFRVRNGTGWGHQAMTTRLRLALFCSSVCLIIICACGLLFIFQRQAGIRVACFVCFCSSLTLGYICFKQKLLVTGVVYKVDWMLVVLGSIHYCNYTCTLSTWSSSTLL